MATKRRIVIVIIAILSLWSKGVFFVIIIILYLIFNFQSRSRKVDLKEIADTIRNSRPVLKEKFKVKDIGIFGSYARGVQNDNSDVLVEFGERVAFFKFLELEEYLEELLNLRVDLFSFSIDSYVSVTDFYISVKKVGQLLPKTL